MTKPHILDKRSLTRRIGINSVTSVTPEEPEGDGSDAIIPSSNTSTVSLDDLPSVYWKEEFSKKQCGVCGYEKETSWEAATTKAQVIAICGDYVREFQKKQEV
jgi:hypothetical protein